MISAQGLYENFGLTDLVTPPHCFSVGHKGILRLEDKGNYDLLSFLFNQPLEDESWQQEIEKIEDLGRRVQEQGGISLGLSVNHKQQLCLHIVSVGPQDDSSWSFHFLAEVIDGISDRLPTP